MPDYASHLMQRVASLLTPEEVQRWEDTELQTTLLKMKDVVFCPRCSTATIEVHLLPLWIWIIHPGAQHPLRYSAAVPKVS